MEWLITSAMTFRTHISRPISDLVNHSASSSLQNLIVNNEDSSLTFDLKNHVLLVKGKNSERIVLFLLCFWWSRAINSTSFYRLQQGISRQLFSMFLQRRTFFTQDRYEVCYQKYSTVLRKFAYKANKKYIKRTNKLVGKENEYQVNTKSMYPSYFFE